MKAIEVGKRFGEELCMRRIKQRSSAVEVTRWGEEEVVGKHSHVESVAERGDWEGANAEAKRSTSAIARLVLFRMDGRVRLAVSLTEYMMKGREDEDSRSL